MNVVSLCQSISLYCTYLPFFLLWWCARRQQQPDETGEANGAGTVTWREAVSEGESSASGRRSTGAAESTTVDNRETIVINWHLPWRQMRSYDLDLDYVPCAFTYTNSHQVAYSPHVLLCLWAVIALKKKKSVLPYVTDVVIPITDCCPLPWLAWPAPSPALLWKPVERYSL